MRVFWCARIAVAAAIACLALAGLAAGPARATGATATAASPALARTGSAVRPDGAYYTAAGGLAGVAAASASSAWAVGYTGEEYSGKVLMLHWNGKAWSRVTSPSVLTGAGALSAITVVSAKDAWAVGRTGKVGSSRTLLLHWNGSAWSRVTSPAPVAGALDTVAATASGGWAAGYVPNGHNWPKSLALRLSGKKWSRVSVGQGGEIISVAITGKGTGWAIGDNEQFSGLARWSGSTWTWKWPTSGADVFVLGDLAAGPGGTAFTVGASEETEGLVSQRLTGSTWKAVSVSAPPTAELNAVAFAPGGTAWAAGGYGRTLILRWNGKAWTRVTSPSTSAVLNGLGFASAKYGWAVGYAGSLDTNPVTGSSKTYIIHWNGSTWS